MIHKNGDSMDRALRMESSYQKVVKGIDNSHSSHGACAADALSLESITTLSVLNNMKARHNDLQREIREFAQKIVPIEFESYHEYFLIKTFKKGISASGHVDIDALRSRKTGVYYKKIRRSDCNGSQNSRNSQEGSPDTLSDEGDDEQADDNYDIEKSGDHPSEDEAYSDSESKSGRTKRRTRAQRAIRIGLRTSESQEKFLEARGKRSDGGSFNSTIAGSNNIDNTRRRSSRLSQKAIESESSALNPNADPDDYNFAKIKDLCESLVPKVREPYRRSDWILPSRSRYTPEKQMHTKPVFEKVKMNELVCSDRIRTVLSRYEGGVAGVRKRGWNAVS